jgi:hypothetical protein
MTVMHDRSDGGTYWALIAAAAHCGSNRPLLADDLAAA